jgi:hypothetical protein
MSMTLAKPPTSLIFNGVERIDIILKMLLGFD